ncbi:MAG: DUF222 domain-containing protein [Ancrocorticia sp.]
MNVEEVPVEVAVELITKLGLLNNAINGLRLGLAAHVDRAVSPPEPIAGQKPEKPKPLPGDQPDLTGLLQSAGGQPRQKARDEIHQARAIRDNYPLFGHELRHGRITPAHIDVLNKRIPAELVEQARVEEARLLECALQGTYEQFVKAIQAWVVKYAPLRAEMKAREEARKEKFSVFPAEGGYRLHGWLNAINGIHLDKTLRALVGVPPVGDRREFAERNADALVAILHGEDPRAVSTAGEGVDGSDSHHASDSQVNTDGLSGISESGNDTSSKQHSGIGRHNPRTHILVHVPLATLVQTEKAIESGCRALDEVSGDGRSTPTGKDRRLPDEDRNRSRDGNGQEPLPSWRGDGSPIAGADLSPSSDRSDDRALFDSPFGSREISGLKRTGQAAQGRTLPSRQGPGEPPDEAIPKCFTTGAGLGRRGKCLEGRDEVTTQLGHILAQIRAGIDASMLEGLAPATLEDGTPLAPSQLAAMLCDSRISRVVLSAYGEPLDASRAQRLFSATQAKAVLARDRTCRYPGCDRGIEVSEIHHAQEWEEGGTTTVDNAVLLCWRHHQAVHQNSMTIHHHAGGFVFTKPDGTRLGVRRHR